MENTKLWPKYAAVIVVVAVLLLDMFFWGSRPSDAPALGWGSLAIGFFLQVAAAALLSQISVITEFPKRIADIGLARRIVAIMVPFLVLSWIGADLVHKGLHEGGTANSYRGQR